MQDYNIAVKDETGAEKEFTVSIHKTRIANKTIREGSDIIQKNDKPQYGQEQSDIMNLLIESTKSEYEHSFRRAERLDNKVYILLTVCAFIFVPISNCISKISTIRSSENSSIAVALYVIMLIISSLLNLSMLIILICALSGKDFKRYNPLCILTRNGNWSHMKS